MKEKNYGRLNPSIRCFLWYVAIVMYIINRNIVNILKVLQCEKSVSCTSVMTKDQKCFAYFCNLTGCNFPFCLPGLQERSGFLLKLFIKLFSMGTFLKQRYTWSLTDSISKGKTHPILNTLEWKSQYYFKLSTLLLYYQVVLFSWIKNGPESSKYFCEIKCMLRMYSDRGKGRSRDCQGHSENIYWLETNHWIFFALFC